MRELANVIKHAVITAREKRLDFGRLLPDVEARPAAEPSARGGATAPSILTAREMEALERENLRRTLEASGWKISGAGGAAERLGLKPTTLTSRMKALDLRRPD